MIRVLLADHHAIVRAGCKLLLESQPGVSVVAEAATAEETCRLYTELRPDVLVMELSLPRLGGLETLKRIRAEDPKARVLVFCGHDDPTYARRALRGGALGFLAKCSPPESFHEAVFSVAEDQRYIDGKFAQKLVLSEIDDGPKSPIERLSEREFQVFLKLAAGATVPRIAASLSLSAATIGTHLYNIKQKLGAENQSALTLLAIRHGLIQP